MPAKKKLTSTKTANKIWALTRISLGLIFIWAFLDKTFGLGFATCRNTKTEVVDMMCSTAWVNGGSPTYGFLKNGTSGPFADFYQSLASTNPNAIINWLFMLGLLGIGIGLLLGIGMKLATYSGVIMMLMMWTAALWPANNPLIDDHIVYALVLIGLLKVNESQEFGFGAKWAKLPAVKKYPILK